MTFSGILFICTRVVAFAARARSAGAANDTTRGQIKTIPEKSFYYHDNRNYNKICPKFYQIGARAAKVSNNKVSNNN